MSKVRECVLYWCESGKHVIAYEHMPIFVGALFCMSEDCKRAAGQLSPLKAMDARVVPEVYSAYICDGVQAAADLINDPDYAKEVRRRREKYNVNLDGSSSVP